MTPDDIYTDPRLAGLYDIINPHERDIAFYAELAGPPPKRLLEMGCGTGELALAWAARGHDVTGVDPAAAMLSAARAKPGASRVRWVESDAAGLSLPDHFDLIVMTGHVFQVFLTDAEIHAALSALRAHLTPGGRLAFETRNPAVREWEDWNEADSAETVEAPGVGPVRVAWQVTATDWPLVTFETRFRFPDGTAVAAPSTLRFMDRNELSGHLDRAGLEAVEWFGDWDRSPVTKNSPEIIAVAGG